MAQVSAYEQFLSSASVVDVTTYDRDEFAAASKDLLALCTEGLDDEHLLTRIRTRAHRLSTELVEMLTRFRISSNEYGSLLLRGLPVGELPSTPTDGSGPKWPELPMADTALSLVMSVLGDPICYADEKKGALIQDVAPVEHSEEHQENSGSVYLEFHTENGFHPFRPDFIGLLCLRADHERVASTATSAIVRALPLLPDAVINVLRRPLFRIRVSRSFTSGVGDPRFSSPAPVLSGDLSRPELRVDFHASEPLTSEAAEALDALKDAMERVLVGAVLEPGDLFVVDNRTAAHARSGFQPQYDGQDRWLRRMSVVTDLRASGHVRQGVSRVCQPLPLYLREDADPILFDPSPGPKRVAEQVS